jgi:hypothetical protein
VKLAFANLMPLILLGSFGNLWSLSLLSLTYMPFFLLPAYCVLFTPKVGMWVLFGSTFSCSPVSTD